MRPAKLYSAEGKHLRALPPSSEPPLTHTPSKVNSCLASEGSTHAPNYLQGPSPGKTLSRSLLPAHSKISFVCVTLLPKFFCFPFKHSVFYTFTLKISSFTINILLSKNSNMMDGVKVFK